VRAAVGVGYASLLLDAVGVAERGEECAKGAADVNVNTEEM